VKYISVQNVLRLQGSLDMTITLHYTSITHQIAVYCSVDVFTNRFTNSPCPHCAAEWSIKTKCCYVNEWEMLFWYKRAWLYNELIPQRASARSVSSVSEKSLRCSEVVPSLTNDHSMQWHLRLDYCSADRCTFIINQCFWWHSPRSHRSQVRLIDREPYTTDIAKRSFICHASFFNHRTLIIFTAWTSVSR